MTTVRQSLNYPNWTPEEYIKLDNEPVFDTSKHLQLETPQSITNIAELGYDEKTSQSLPSKLGVTSAFRILSDEGVRVVYDLCKKMESNKNETTGTGKNRLGSYIRGAGYRSKFMHDLWRAPELATFLSDLTGVKLANHSVPAVACGINYAPEDISKAVDNWHVDSISFDMVMLMVDPSTLDGGEFQYFVGTKQEGEALLGVQGEAGGLSELPSERVVTVEFPAAGYGFLQQGNMIFHRACKLNEKAERITIIPSFVVLESDKRDGTNIEILSKWNDPGLPAELARHEAWMSMANLQDVIDYVSLEDDKLALAEKLDKAVSSLTKYANHLKQSS